MDFSQAAMKLMCIQLKQSKQAKQPLSSQSSFNLYGLLFQRAWLQGIIVSLSSDRSSFVLDDGSGTIDVFLGADFLKINKTQWQIGMYVMVVGVYVETPDEDPYIKVHKIVDLSAYPHREAMWYLEVIEAYNMFYQPNLEDD